MKEVKNEKLEKLIEDIKNDNISNEEIQKLFEGYQLYMSKDEFANLVIDLFLETVPYEETRGYGRKLIGAASLYGWLYYDKPIYEVVSSIVD
jgi:hypothetical protein